MVSSMDAVKRECILAEAAKAFARFGFRKASVDEIAKAAGVAKGTVYLAAESKQDLFYQVLHREIRAWVAETARLIDPRQPADRLLARVSEAGFKYLGEHTLVRDLLFGETMEVLPADWGERLSQLRELGRANVVEILRLGVKQGVFRADLDVEPVAAVLMDVQAANYLFLTRGLYPAEHLPERLKAGADVVLNGLRKR
jgi:AcrR family transcriptional regulator